jgi:hypothetical protein
MHRGTVKGQNIFFSYPSILLLFFLISLNYYPNHQINPNLLLIRWKSKKDLPITSLCVASDLYSSAINRPFVQQGYPVLAKPYTKGQSSLPSLEAWTRKK